MLIDGIWEFTINAPTGAQGGRLHLKTLDHRLIAGEIHGLGRDMAIRNGEIIGNDLFWVVDTTNPVRLTMRFSTTVVEGRMTGEVELGNLSTATFDATFVGPWHRDGWKAQAEPVQP